MRAAARTARSMRLRFCARREGQCDFSHAGIRDCDASPLRAALMTLVGEVYIWFDLDLGDLRGVSYRRPIFASGFDAWIVWSI